MHHTSDIRVERLQRLRRAALFIFPVVFLLAVLKIPYVSAACAWLWEICLGLVFGLTCAIDVRLRRWPEAVLFGLLTLGMAALLIASLVLRF